MRGRPFRTVHITDLHITADDRFKDQEQYLQGIAERVLALSPDIVLVTGDLFGHQVPYRSKLEERRLLQWFTICLAAACPVVFIYGNHDYQGDLDWLTELEREWPILVFSSTSQAGESVYTPSGPCRIYPLPYPTRRWLLADSGTGMTVDDATVSIQERLTLIFQVWGSYIRAARERNPDVPHILAAHIQVRGCQTAGSERLVGGEIELTTGTIDLLRADYAALGHIHMTQEMTTRAWYAGATWFNDHGETKRVPGWAVVDLHERPEVLAEHAPTEPDQILLREYAPGEGADTACRVYLMPTRCRRFLTLDFAWGVPSSEPDGATPRWLKYPSQEEFELVWNSEVRVRLVKQELHRATCPWETELEKLKELAPSAIREIQKVEPSYRIRQPEVVRAESVEQKLDVLWGAQKSPPTDNQRALARELHDALRRGETPQGWVKEVLGLQ